MKFSMISLGCSKNLVDSEMMMGQLQQAGLEYVTPEQAEVIVINTCGFIEPAKQESIDTILETAEFKKTGALQYLMVAGCLVQRYAQELAQEIPEVDAYFGVGDFARVVEILHQLQENPHQIVLQSPPENYLYQHQLPRMQATLPATAYVKIADGCDNRCSYCAIPMIRGVFRSRTIEDILIESRRLVEQGVKEICLIAQDCTLYGQDLYGDLALGRLCKELVEIEGLEWLRILYCYPSHFTDDFIDLLATHPKMCQYIDLPLQHCQTHLLKDMNRTGTKEEILALISELKSKMPDLVLRTSYIVGYPGETLEDVQALVSFVQETAFDHVGVFTYSAEEGTPAAEKDDQIDEAEKERRRNMLMEAQQKVVIKNNRQWLDKSVQVLAEKRVSEEQWIGRFQGQAPDIDGLVIVNGKAKPGEMHLVKITGIQGYDLLAMQLEKDGIA